MKLNHFDVNHLILELNKKYGMDFSDYAVDSFSRRLDSFLRDSNFTDLPQLTQRLIQDEQFYHSFVSRISVPVSEMFRDPPVFKLIRDQITNYLKTFTHVKIWHAGCSTGEEVYSLAIILKEEGLLDKCLIYATDINQQALYQANEGVYSKKDIESRQRSYELTGGKHSLDHYFTTQNQFCMVHSFLKERITFSRHNLVSDQNFGQMNMILCRNVFIYFNKNLQDRTLKLFNASLLPNGFLVLGDKESLQFRHLETSFQEIQNKSRIYKKRDSS